MMSARRSPFFAAALCLALSACLHAGPGADPLEQAKGSASRPDASARAVALAGFEQLLVEGRAESAEAAFDRAAKGGGDPYALVGQMLLARRAGHPERALDAALQLMERFPSHPLASMAARFTLDIQGTAAPLDDAIVSRGKRALAGGLFGDAAHLLRSALANIHGQRGELDAQAAVLADLGTPDRFALVGPFSPYHLLDLDGQTAPEKTGSLEGKLSGPFGPLAPRELVVLDGRMSLEGEPATGDVYLLAADFEVTQPTRYTVRTISVASHKVYVDGALLVDRRDFPRPTPTVAAAGVVLAPGRHRLLVRLLRDAGQGSLTVSVMRADGKPAGLHFTPASGPAPRWSGAEVVSPDGTFPRAADLQRALEPEVGTTLATYLAARDGLGRDRDGVKPLVEALASRHTTPPILMLRAELSLIDRGIPQKVARGRATRDLEAVLEADKGDVQALVTRTNLAVEEQRNLDASEYVKRARAARPDVGYPVLLAEARVQNALGISALADQTAQAALAVQPGLCDALSLRYDFARQQDAVQDADALVAALKPCPGSLSRSAEHARTRGDAASAIQLYRRLVERDPSQVNANLALANALVSDRRYDDAAQLLERALAVWPRSATLASKLADVEDLAGQKDQALAMRERALLNDGSNLALRRTVERARTGKEVLADWAIDGQEAIRAYEANPGSEDATAATILDAAAVRVYPDGSSVDRTHMIQKALDQSGVQDIAEVTIPTGAEVLTLRTIKPDGRTLEPEGISGKESVSLPGVQVGDYVEVEYLQAHDPRGPAQPGFTAASFYYQLARIPNHWSTYRIIAPKGMGMTVDAHNMKAVSPKVQGDLEVFDHEERRVAPFIPEPDSPPSGNEYLPFVSVGAGAKGNEGVVSAYADANVDNAQITYEISQFAKAAAGGKVGLEAAKAIHRAVMDKLTGQDSGLSASAAASLAQDRGSRLWLMKAALEAVGIPTRIAAVRTFSADPAPYVFPNEGLLPYVCLRAELPGGQVVWLDTAVRFGPFGVLPEAARDRDAYLMPEPGRPLEAVHTPKGSDPGKRLTLDVELGADGVLTGTAEEVYSGLEAAQIGEALEQLPPDQRNQAVQGALARYFGGAELSKLELKVPREVGANVTIHYSFRAPRFARVDGDRLVLQAITFPVSLGRRFVELGSRRTPLYIGETEEAASAVRMKLPAGMHLVEPLDQRPLSTPFGIYERRERQQGQVVQIDEHYRLDMARIPPAKYDAFAQFAGEVDLIQSRDLIVSK